MIVVAQGFVDWSWFNDRNVGRLLDLFVEHVQLTVLALLFGMAIAFPLAVAAVRWRRLYNPLLAVNGVLFTIPSVALFVLLLAYTPFGINKPTSVIGLTIYTLLILFRNAVAGLDGVPRDVRETAEAMGYRRRRQLLRVEIPLALPVIIAGIRIATVTTLGLVTITAFIGQGGFGQLFITGFQRQNSTEVLVGLVASVILAVTADLFLVAVERRLTPWARTGT